MSYKNISHVFSVSKSKTVNNGELIYLKVPLTQEEYEAVKKGESLTFHIEYLPVVEEIRNE